MNEFLRKADVYYWHIVIAVLGLLIGASLFFAYKINDDKLSTILAGLAAGGAGVIVQIILQWQTYTQISDLKRLRIERVIRHRDKFELYRDYLGGAKRRIKLLANTSQRFLEHFANENVERADQRVLITALQKGVILTVLVPNPNGVQGEDQQRIQGSLDRLQRLQEEFPDQVEFRCFNGPPAHSVLVVDDTCFVGPMFPGFNRSRDLPAIITDVDSEMGRPYIRYLDKVWSDVGGN